LRGRQRRAQRELEGQFLVRPLASLWESGEHLQPFGDVADCLEVGGALEGSLAGPLPMGNSRCAEARLGVVMGEQFGLSFHRLWKLGLQHLRNALVILLPGALEERLIGGLLDEGMLEDVRRLWWKTALVHEFCVYQPVQLTLQSGFV